MRAYERFLNYVQIHTRSDESSESVPSTARQFTLARRLAEELQALGVADAAVDERCYVYASIPATKGREHDAALGFIAHLDTADFPGEDVKPRLHPDYDGGELKLGGTVLSPKNFPHLPNLRGRTLITASGDTLLGADDKAGVAEIMTLAERLLREGTPHGKICIGFTPDEEIGRGADLFDVARFGAAFAFTVDGGPEGEIEFENFNACEADVHVTGVDVHPGYAKDVMVNAVAVAAELQGLLPAGQSPRDTSGYEGFFHLMKLDGGVSEANARYIIRDHDADTFEARKRTLLDAAARLNERYGAGTVRITVREQYRNMKEVIARCPQLIERAKRAAQKAGLEPIIRPIRGGTDGANLSYMGLPCPNLGTGGYAFHGPFEHITVETMDQVTDMLLALAAGEDAL